MASEKKDDALVERQKSLVALDGADSLDMLFEESKFNQMQRAANMFAESQLVPDHFRNKPANVMVALQLSYALRVNPLLLMMKIYEVKGSFGFESQLMISLANSRGPFRGTIRYRMEGEGDTRKCTAYAHHREDGAICESECSIRIAKDEGWFDRKDRSGKFCSKWRTMPDLMLQYRSASFLVKTHCPEVLMGMQTIEELEDIDTPALQVTATVSDIDDAVAEANALKAEQPKPPAKTAKKKADPKPVKQPEKPVEATAEALPAAQAMHPDTFDSLEGCTDRDLANHVYLQAMAAGWTVDGFIKNYDVWIGKGQSPQEALASMKDKFDNGGK